MFRNNTIPSDAVAITPDDTTVLDLVGFYVGGAGDVTVSTASGDVTFYNMPAGGDRALRISKIKATGTTATQIVGLK